MDLKNLVKKRFLAKEKRTNRIVELIDTEYSPSGKYLKVHLVLDTQWFVDEDRYEILEVLE